MSKLDCMSIRHTTIKRLLVLLNRRLLVLCLVAVGLSACTRNATDTAPIVAQAQPTTDVLDQVQEDETVLATVNGSRIGELDLTINLVRTLGDAYPQFADAKAQEQVLQSMIASRAIAMKRLASLSTDEQVSLEKRVAQFREELLVKQYLVENGRPQTVNAQQVATYYEDNPEEFTGSTERLYELLTIDPENYSNEPALALQSLNRAKTHDDWRVLAAESEQEAHPVVHSFQTLIGDTAQGAIEAAVLKLNEGELSRVVISNSAPYMARLLEVAQQPVIPLIHAKADIHKRLLMATVRESVRTVSDEVVAESDVVLSQSGD